MAAAENQMDDSGRVVLIERLSIVTHTSSLSDTQPPAAAAVFVSASALLTTAPAVINTQHNDGHSSHFAMVCCITSTSTDSYRPRFTDR